MDVHISRHTLARALRRGVTAEEILDVVVTGRPVPAELGRFAREKTYDFRADWQGRYYEQKKVKVIYVVEAGEAWTVTVISYYGKWAKL